MSTRSSPKTPYEIRLELLQLAQLVLQNQHNGRNIGSSTTEKTSPTTEDIIAEAEKMNTFISKASTH